MDSFELESPMFLKHPSFFAHYLKRLNNSLSGWNNSVDEKKEFVKSIFDYVNKDLNHIPKGISERGQNIIATECFDLIIKSLQKKNISKELPKSSNLYVLVDDFVQNRKSAKKVYENISTHHQRLQGSTINQNNLLLTDDIEELTEKQSFVDYAGAAKSMGERPWVIECNKWMYTFCKNFFCHGWARKAYFRSLIGKSGKSWEDCQGKNDIKADITKIWKDSINERARSKKIQVLDIGSCYNPFIKFDVCSCHAMDSAENECDNRSMQVTAIDLYPTDNSVFQCDFLKVKVDDMSCLRSGDIDLSASLISDKSKVSVSELPFGSFDCATMSLVLNYLPSPEQRLRMVVNARKCLKSRGNAPHDTGLLLIVEKESIFSVHNDSLSKEMKELPVQWINAIQKLDFELVKYYISTSSDSKHRFHVFAFRTIEKADCVQNSAYFEGKYEALLAETVYVGDRGKEKSGLLIRQDFDIINEKYLNNNTNNVVERPGEDIISKSIIQDFVFNQQHIQKLLKKEAERLALTVTEAAVHPSEVPANFKVGIIGGGIAGAMLGLCLHKSNIAFSIYEKDVNIAARAQGYGLTIQQGNSVLNEVGLLDIVRKHGVFSTSHSSYTSSGDILGAYGVEVYAFNGQSGALERRMECDNSQVKKRKLVESGDDQSGFSSEDDVSFIDVEKAITRKNLHIPRQVFRQIILGSIPQNCIYWSKELLSLEILDDSAGVTLRFADGTTDTATVVVGADGIFSNVRDMMKNYSSNSQLERRLYDRSLVFLNTFVILGIAPNPLGFVASQHQWVDGQGTRVFVMPFDSERVMWQLSVKMTLDEANILCAQQSKCDKSIYEFALSRTKNWSIPLKCIVESSDSAFVTGYPIYDLDLPSISIDNAANPLLPVVLIGDAVHPMSPFKGQGANQALIDAFEYANMLKSYFAVINDGKYHPENLHSHVKQYYEKMFQRVSSKVRKSRRAADILHSNVALTSANITRAAAAESHREL